MDAVVEKCEKEKNHKVGGVAGKITTLRGIKSNYLIENFGVKMVKRQVFSQDSS